MKENEFDEFASLCDICDGRNIAARVLSYLTGDDENDVLARVESLRCEKYRNIIELLNLIPQKTMSAVIREARKGMSAEMEFE